MTAIVELEYFKIKGRWTWRASLNGVTANGDLYPGTRKGLAEAKRDAAESVAHLRKKNHIKVKRG